METNRIIIFFVIVVSVCPNSRAAEYHTMLYIKVVNFTESGTNHPVTKPVNGEEVVCCRSIPCDKVASHFCESVFSVRFEGLEGIIFNISFQDNIGKDFKENYGVGMLNLSSVNQNKNLYIFAYELLTDLKTRAVSTFVSDTLLGRIEFRPSSSFWSGKLFIQTLRNRTCLTIEVKTFCESNWYTARTGCSQYIPVTDFETVHFNTTENRLIPELDSPDIRILKVKLITKKPYMFTTDVLKSRLAMFIADKVCNTTPGHVKVTISNVRYDSCVLRVVFTGQCCSGSPSAAFAELSLDILDLNITTALSYLTPSEELQYFTAPVLPANTASNNSNACEDKQVACNTVPCLNNGTCETMDSDYSCKCLEGFDGKQCERNTNTCTQTNCINGFCQLIEGSEKCICFDGYFGTNCDYGIRNCSRCRPNPCNNGKCVESNRGEFVCVCNKGYSGSLCEVELPTSQNVTDAREIREIVLLAIVGILTAIIVVLIITICRLKGSDRRKVTSNVEDTTNYHTLERVETKDHPYKSVRHSYEDIPMYSEVATETKHGQKMLVANIRRDCTKPITINREFPNLAESEFDNDYEKYEERRKSKENRSVANDEVVYFVVEPHEKITQLKENDIALKAVHETATK